MNYKEKYIKYKNKYLLFKNKYQIGGKRYLLEDGTIVDKLPNETEEDKCMYISTTKQPPILKRQINYQESKKLMEKLNIGKYDNLMIIFGGKCYNSVPSNECLELRKLPEIIKQGKTGKKTLIIVIDTFDVTTDTGDKYTFELQEQDNIDIQFLKLGVTTNQECIFNQNINNYIGTIIDKKGLVIIVDFMILINNKSHYLNDSEIINTIIKPEYLINKNTLITRYIYFINNLDLRSSIFGSNKLTEKWGYNLFDEINNFLEEDTEYQKILKEDPKYNDYIDKPDGYTKLNNKHMFYYLIIHKKFKDIINFLVKQKFEVLSK